MGETTAAAQATTLIAAIRRGDRLAFDRLFEMVYEDLHHRAHWQLRQASGAHTINTTALVHEAYLKLIGTTKVDWENLAHFYGIAAKAMRQILIDRARQRLSLKRGGEAKRLDIDSVEIGIDDHAQCLIGLDAALDDLATLDVRLTRIVELRFFAELSVEDTARVLAVSPRTVKRDWRLARAYLHDRIGQGGR